jgi:hypothetical protein
MFIAIQVALLVVGLYIMSRGRFDIGDRTVTNPVASLVGIVLAAQLPLALLIGIILGLTDSSGTNTVQVPTRAGTPVAVQVVAPPRSLDDNWWVDPLVTCSAILLSAAMIAIALRNENDTEDVYASLSRADGEPAQ